MLEIVQKIFIIGEGDDAGQMARKLEDAGYETAVYALAEAPARLRSEASPRAVVVDVSSLRAVPDLAGLLSPADETPILAILTEKQLAENAGGLAVDEFALRPLRPRELEARVRHMLDRRQGTDSPDVLRQGALAIDLVGYRVFVGGALVEMTFKEYELLRFLATHPNRVFTREALLNKVWGYDYFGGARTVDVHVRRIRSKIERGGHVFIETVRSVGYRFRPSSPPLP